MGTAETSLITRLRRALPRMDSWLNAVTNVGGALGKNAFTFQRAARLDDETLEALYHGDAYAARICDVVPEEALREGVTVRCAAAPALTTACATQFDRLGVLTKVADAWTWGRLFGGGVVFVGADDGLPPHLPLNIEAIRSVRFLTVLTKRELQPQDWYRDPLSPKFGEVETYRFVRVGGGGGVDHRAVHETRLIRFEGARTSRWRRMQNQGWSESELERVIDHIRALGGAFAAVGALLQDGSQGVLKIKDLMRLIGEDAQGEFKQRMEMMEYARSVARSILLDSEGEEYERVDAAALTGVSDVLDKFMLYVAGAAKIPVTILMGQSPAGLSATGESDLEWFRDRLRSEQVKVLKPRLERLVRILLRAQDGPTGGREPAGWSIEFPPLERMSDAEQAELRNKQAQTDQLYITAGVVTAEEVALSRFRPEGWSAETTISLADREAAQAADRAGEGDGGAPAGESAEGIMDVVERVGTRAIDRAAGIGLLTTQFGLAPEQAEAVMGETGRTHFTTPEPGHAAEMESLRAQNAAAQASARGAKQMLARVLERNKAGELVLGNVIAAKPTETQAGDVLEEGDVVAVPADAPAPDAPPAPKTDAGDAPDFVPPGAAALAARGYQRINRDGARVPDFRADAAGERGVAIVLPLDGARAEGLAVPGGVPWMDLHCTLAFLGTVDQVDELTRSLARAAVATWAARTAPIAGTLGGRGCFAGAAGQPAPVVLLPDCPALAAAREDLVRALAAVGVEVSSAHGFVPHVTVEYVAEGQEPHPAPAGPTAVTFGSVGLWIGTARESFALAGEGA